jgi:ATP-binding cassette subfamily B protein
MTELGQRGLSLSGGQKQRLSIARTIARKPDLLLLDDCTAAMDADTERVFWQNLRQTMPDATVLVVTHRLATAREADRIIVIEDSTIKECGTFDELIANNDAFCRISDQRSV